MSIRSSVIDEANRVLAEFQRPEPVFGFEIGWSRSYDELFREADQLRTDVDGVLPAADGSGRVLIHGEGGSGKTSILGRLYEEATKLGRMPLWMDLKRWTPELASQWDALVDSDVLRLELLIDQVGIGVEKWESQSLVAEALREESSLFLDGLNEAPNPYPNQILSALEIVARTNPQSHVIASDRLLRRELPSESWRLAGVRRAFADAATHPYDPSPLLESAFFLDLAINRGLDSTSGSLAFRQYFEEHVGLGGDQLMAAASAAFRAYASSSERTFLLADFVSTSGPSVTERLREAGTLVEVGERGYFTHHLFHDYLAAVWMSHDAEEWGRETFDMLTFQASSFDVLALTLQEIQASDAADSLLREIYDWNYYASAYALSRGRALGAAKASSAMEVALLAMLAERRWDPVQPTAERVSDALALFPGPIAQGFRDAADLAAIIDIVRDSDLPAEFESWRALFIVEPRTEANWATVECIDSSEPMVGWTAANVLRRVRLSGDQIDDLKGRLGSSALAVVRWRAAHALGAHAGRSSADALFEALGDSDQWVRYGVIRSLVEQAASSPQLRQLILRRLAARMDDVAQDQRVLGELERAVLLRDPPAGWDIAVSPIIERLWARASTLEEQDHWRGLAARVRSAASA